MPPKGGDIALPVAEEDAYVGPLTPFIRKEVFDESLSELAIETPTMPLPPPPFPPSLAPPRGGFVEPAVKVLEYLSLAIVIEEFRFV